MPLQVYYFIRKLHRPSIVILLLGSIVGVACILLVANSIYELAGSWTTASEMFAIDTSFTTCSYYS
jgi:uncharacterized integral membrane protein